MHDNRKDAPSFHRNIGPIIDRYHDILGGDRLNILEVGSGSGQHAVALCKEFPEISIQPTEVEEESLSSIIAWIDSTAVENAMSPRILDVTKPDAFFDGYTKYDIVQCFNVIHISPWQVTEGLFQLANKVTGDRAKVILYGPFRINGKQTSESNEQFELWLKAKSPEYGVRDLGEVSKVAEANGFCLAMRHAMPSNNFLVEFDKEGS